MVLMSHRVQTSTSALAAPGLAYLCMIKCALVVADSHMRDIYTH